MRRIATDSSLQVLAEGIDLATGRQEPARVRTAEDVLRRSRERLARGPEQVVVALGGGTGSGKSSVSNALAGTELSKVGPVRPTTDRALLWSVGPVDPELVDWLGVMDRQVRSPSERLPEGLVVLDLPDHDSVRTSHRDTVDAAVKVVDVMVFVVDPLKYAQRSLFEGYLRPLANHAEVLLVVLNRVDELGPDDQRRCVTDLRRLLDETGLSQARVLLTSALTGDGIDELRTVLADETRSRRAITERITADVATAAELLLADIDPAATVGESDAVVAALASVADLSGAVATAAGTYRERGLAATRPPITGLLARGGRRVTRPFRASAAVRLRESGRLGGAHVAEDPADADQAGRSRRGHNVALRHALRALIEPLSGASGAVPRTWAERLRGIAEELTDRLTTQTRDALDVVALHPPRRLWWAVVGFLWTLIELAIVVGVGWLAALFVIAWLQLPDPPTPQLGAVPWPTVLVLAGIPLWLLFRGLRAVAVRRGAARHALRTAKRLRAQVAAATEVGLRPVTDEVSARDRLVELLRPVAAAGPADPDAPGDTRRAQ